MHTFSRSMLTRDECKFADSSYYTVIVGPGEVRYLQATNFFNADVEQVINEIRTATSTPVVHSPRDRTLFCATPFAVRFDCALLDQLLATAEWDDRLRAHHAIGGIAMRHGVPPWVYVAFHTHLRLNHRCATVQCAEAWVKGTEWDRDMARSFDGSGAHVVIEDSNVEMVDGNGYAVFFKTAFVQSRLNAIADAELQARVAEEGE